MIKELNCDFTSTCVIISPSTTWLWSGLPGWLWEKIHMLSYININLNKNLCTVHTVQTFSIFVIFLELSFVCMCVKFFPAPFYFNTVLCHYVLTYWSFWVNRPLQWWWGSSLQVWAGPGLLAPSEPSQPWILLHPSPPSSLWTLAWVVRKCVSDLSM